MNLPGIKTLKDNLNFELFLSVFALLDVCLYPYIRPLRCTTSMLLLMIWYAYRLIQNRSNLKHLVRTLIADKEVIAFLISVVCIIASLIAGMVSLPATVPSSYQSGEISVFSRTVTYSVIYVFVFLYYFFYREMVKKYQNLIYITIKAVFAVIFVFALVYLVSPAAFYSIRSFWTLSGKVQNATTAASSYYRYTFSFSDPNNIAAMTVAITILLVENKKEKRLIKYGAFAMCAIILLGTMSVQGILGMVAYLGVKSIYLLYKIINGKIVLKKRTVYVAIGILVAVLALLPVMLQIPVVEKAFTRILNNGGSFLTRWNVWKKLIQGNGFFDYLLFGRGCAIILNGEAVSPHNGHLYILYAYGFVAYLSFMYVFYVKKRSMKWKRMFFLIPFFLCFSINVGLIDARYSFCMAIITAFGFAIAQANNVPRATEDFCHIRRSRFCENH